MKYYRRQFVSYRFAGKIEYGVIMTIHDKTVEISRYVGNPYTPAGYLYDPMPRLVMSDAIIAQATPDEAHGYFSTREAISKLRTDT